MKIHLSAPHPPIIWPAVIDALETWEHEGLVPSELRACDGKMVLITNKSSLTKVSENVTCKHCLKVIDRNITNH